MKVAENVVYFKTRIKSIKRAGVIVNLLIVFFWIAGFVNKKSNLSTCGCLYIYFLLWKIKNHFSNWPQIHLAEKFKAFTVLNFNCFILFVPNCF